MKKVVNPYAGQLVQIPAYEFAPMRTGWNGWMFKAGVTLQRLVRFTIQIIL